MITTSSTITVVFNLTKKEVTSYVSGQMHLEVKSGNSSKLVHAPTVVNTTGGSGVYTQGTVTFSSVPLFEGSNMLVLMYSANADLDTANVAVTTLARTSITKATSVSTVTASVV